jgi:hypothetical protein
MTEEPVRSSGGQEGVALMPGERVVFTEESDPERYVKLIAAGEIYETLLDALTDYVKRQRKRLGAISQRPDQSPTPRDPSETDDDL